MSQAEQNSARPEIRGVILMSAKGTSWVSAIFTLTVAALLMANTVTRHASDPLERPQLEQLFKQQANNPAVMKEARQLDRLARHDFFSSQAFARRGATLLLIGAITLLISANLAYGLKKRFTYPGPYAPNESSLRVAKTSRIALCVFAAIVVAVALMIIRASFPTPLSDGERLPPKESVAAQVQPKPPATVAAKVAWPGFRGPGGIGMATVNKAPLSWDGKTGKNIAWKTRVPKPGLSSPIVVGDRVFLSGGDATLREVYCFDAQTGTILWQKAADNIPDSPTSPPEVSEDTGFAAPTMATDGQHVFAIFATGDLICHDLKGNRIWTTNMGVPENHYAHSSSLIVYKDMVIVQFDDDAAQRVTAYKGANGEIAWETDRTLLSWTSPICVNTGSRMELILMCNESVDSYNPDNGMKIWGIKCLDGEVGASPTFANGRLFVIDASTYASCIQFTGPQPAIAWQNDNYLSEVASPVATEKYLFIAASGGTIACLSTATGKMIWEQEFDDEFYSSPIVVGNNVYATDREGHTYVFAIADKYQSISKASIGEPTGATPAFVEGAIFIRGEKRLFCIREK